jgi:7-dehydrocholesterol reductase
MGEMLSVMIVASYTISIFLYCKAHIHSSSEDWATTGNVLVDFFWGMELYPRLGKNFDIKDFLHCRLGMMAWAILIISCAIKQHATEGRVSKSLGVTSLLMLAYTSKFFFTESEYWSSAGMVKDRGGSLDFCSRTCLHLCYL